jgi:hypothetical protein
LFLTYYLQQTLGYSPLVTGVAFLPISAGLVVASNRGCQPAGAVHDTTVRSVQKDCSERAVVLRHEHDPRCLGRFIQIR